jgi:Putative F0F1-ATPase subunit Ca2+/Mg2+ transporter
VSEFTKFIGRKSIGRKFMGEGGVGPEPDQVNEKGPGRVPPVAGSLYGGFGETLAQAFEFAVVPVLFGLLGVWLDGRLGTGPWLTVLLLVVGIIGVVARAIYAYKVRVEAEEEGKPWTRRRK